MAEHALAEHAGPTPAERSASAAELWRALRDAGRAGSRTGLGRVRPGLARMRPGLRRMRPGLPRGLVTGIGLATLAATASAALMGLAGWLIVRSAQTGLSTTSTFSWIFPSAGVEALAVVRTSARYGERLTTHRATLVMLARLRARVFASATRMAPRQLRRFRSGDMLDRIQADIDSLDRVVLAVAVPAVVCAIVGAGGLAVLALIRPAFGGVVAIGLAATVVGDVAVSRRSRRAGRSWPRRGRPRGPGWLRCWTAGWNSLATGRRLSPSRSCARDSAPRTGRADAGRLERALGNSAQIWPPPAPWQPCWPAGPGSAPGRFRPRCWPSPCC